MCNSSMRVVSFEVCYSPLGRFVFKCQNPKSLGSIRGHSQSTNQRGKGCFQKRTEWEGKGKQERFQAFFQIVSRKVFSKISSVVPADYRSYIYEEQPKGMWQLSGNFSFCLLNVV